MSQVSITGAPREASSANVIVNFMAFQIGWFACVLGAAWGRPWIGTAIAAAVVALHLWCVARPGQELRLIAAALAIGLAWDSLLMNLGLVTFQSGFPLEYAAPQWILALWALFATTLNVSLRWLQGRWLVAALLGAAAGPLSYWAGMRLGALVLPELLPALLALAVGWGAMTPLLLVVARRFNGVNATR
jgi:Protein of unknown function (DUF2878)